MEIYHYHPDTLEYLGSSQADESPLEPGVFLIPAHATDKALPKEQAGKRRIFEGGVWVQRNIPPPEPTPEPTPEEIKAKAVGIIEQQRDMALAAGVTWNGNKYHVDQTMIAAMTGRLTLWQEGTIDVAAKLPIRRMDNIIEMLGRAEHASLADALRKHGDAVYAASWVEKDKLK